jgi:hypothetical protein
VSAGRSLITDPIHGKKPQGNDIGHCFVAIDPGLFRDRDDFAADVTRLCDDLRAIKPVDPSQAVMVADDPQWNIRGAAAQCRIQRLGDILLRGVSRHGSSQRRTLREAVRRTRHPRAAPPDCDVIFTANSGHELGHLGLADFVARRPGWEGPISEGGASWVHFGANLGAAGGTLSLQSASPDLRELAVAHLARAGRAPDVIAAVSVVPSGETRDIHPAGGRYVTLVGSNPLFHLPQDRWPHAVDIEVVTRITSASAALVVTMTR